MTSYLYIDEDRIGEVDLIIVDEVMGAIGGNFVPLPSYHVYQDKIQALSEEKELQI